MTKSSSIAMDSSKQLSVMGILREALYIPNRNWKLMLPSMLLAILSSSLLLIGDYFSIYPLLLNFIVKLYRLSQKDPNTPQFIDLLVGIKEDVEALVHVDMIFSIASYVISLFSMMIIIYTSAMTFSAKNLTLKDLSLRIIGTWKGPLITRLYFTLLHIGYTVISVSLIAILLLNAGGSMGLIVLGLLLALLARLLYVYLAMVWMVGVVVSVVEEGCYGMGALWKGGELVKGRRAQGFFIALSLLVIETILGSFYGYGITRAQPQLMTQHATGLVLVNVVLLLNMFSRMVYTVFYFECRKSHGKDVQMVGGISYNRVPVGPIVDSQV